MFKMKPYVILVTIVGTLLLLYGTTFISAKISPVTEGSSTLMLSVTEGIVGFGLLMALVVGSMYYFMKSRFEDHRHKH